MALNQGGEYCTLSEPTSCSRNGLALLLRACERLLYRWGVCVGPQEGVMAQVRVLPQGQVLFSIFWFTLSVSVFLVTVNS